MFPFAKINKNVQSNSLFLGIPKMFICVRVRQVAFFFLRTEKSCPSEAVSSLRFLF